uniref:Uncharacterized protein n=1 Tax=Hucho hucho TaxID=62062 RepID=A0A4W5L593_9TELE
MKTVILLLSVAMVLFDSGALRHHRNQDFNLEKIISMVENYTHTLPEVLLQTLLADVTHLTVTTTNCQEFFFEAETILASVKFGDGGEIIRRLGVYNKQKSQGNQVELRRLLNNLNECGHKIYSKP